MALELLGGPFDLFVVIDHARVYGRVDQYAGLQSYNSHRAMWIEGRGFVTNVGPLRHRFVVQYDGSVAQIGASRFGQYGVYVLACGDGGARGYAESQTYPVAGGRLYALHPLTLAGFQDIGEACPNAEPFAARLPDGSWLRTANYYGVIVGRVSAIQRHRGIAWATEATLPITRPQFLSWADDPEELWLGNEFGELVRFNWRTNWVSPISRIASQCKGVWYSTKHGVFVSAHYEYLSGTSGPTRHCTRVWATTPRPTAIVQTVTPAPTAGRVSRVASRVVGSFGEPCAGEAVRWSVPDGYQVVPRSPTTDQDGYARADLIVPMGAIGSASVTAEAVL